MIYNFIVKATRSSSPEDAVSILFFMPFALIGLPQYFYRQPV
jgi:hypothetical protein